MKRLQPHACRRCLTDKPHRDCDVLWWQCLDCPHIIGGYRGQILRAVEAHYRAGCRAVGVRVEC